MYKVLARVQSPETQTQVCARVQSPEKHMLVLCIRACMLVCLPGRMNGWGFLVSIFAYSDPKEITNTDILEKFQFVDKYWYIYFYIVCFKDIIY